MIDRNDMAGTVISHYRMGEKLGEGGMGVVYRAEDLTLRRPVAIKFLRDEEALAGSARARFLREARVVAALNHPGVCSIYELGEADDTIFIVMEFVTGVTLRRWMMRGEPVSGLARSSRALSIAALAADGLGAAHQAGIVHRDVKPENIMLTDDGRVKVMDFGLAKISGQTQLTRQGGTVGTFAYMSPEQARGEVVDHHTDIWSLGVVLYEMLSGRLPFHADHAPAMIYQIVTADPLPLPGKKRDISENVNTIVMRCLAKTPRSRYASMKEFAREVRKELSWQDSPTVMYSPAITETATPPDRPRRNARAFFLASGLVVACLALFVLWRTWPPSQNRVIDMTGETPPGVKQNPAEAGVSPQRDAPVIRPPESPESRRVSRATSAEELASLLSASLGKNNIRRPRTVIVQPFTYRNTRIAGSFSSYFKTLLENRLVDAAHWHIVENPAAQDSGAGEPGRLPGVDPEGLCFLTGTYWEMKDDVKFLATLRGVSDGQLLGSAEGTLWSGVFRRIAFPLKPDNFEQAVKDQELFSEGKPAGGSLHLEAWTNKGSDHLIFRSGERMRLYVRVNRPCSFRIIYNLADGRRALLTGPPGFRIDQTSVDKPTEIHGHFECSPPFGVESIQVFARTEEFEPIHTVKVDGYDILDEDLREFLVKTRGFKRINDDEQQAEALLTLTTIEK